ncbi:hypothetical protein L2E82_28515 [Cichorium intybus]|uniref:Uncharacterized protein n=1 Tax=Cichorium intybus TaxID=13427 RepID=A0ACB9CW05_CICIN|nr:hypothetical protein L2E82_28515 [Cichorium intybus]
MGCTIFNESYTLVFKLFLHFIDVPKGVDNGHVSIVLDMKELSDSNSQNWDNWYLGFLIVVGFSAIFIGMLAVKLYLF